MPCRPGDPGDGVERLERPDLVVGPHHADQRDGVGVVVDGLGQRVDVDDAGAVDRDELDAEAFGVRQPVQRVERRVVLDRTC